ncbi:site-specific DNA-methyltransferase [Candidatus Synechococcus calcipolaris G9]|uniref:site-specific DNA-methyltransferase (cytosine-N(4)-specific) n=1 Tax=Candidatus Synechococcus calcipolaris G9 TaxID=1497997 RepID=A0ABT6F364_9SYNE|nr:DNA methyltransferase [Candidatus Synechococcus calcipolaris]MDG2992313.1 site-specific DNA-methyltransferase [Candidatus Synechococcus calcipolaris G9]
MSYVVQAKDGSELNRFYEDDLLIHNWYRFVLSYPPHLVKHYLQKFNINNGHWVLDPFCGTGTTLVECKKQEISSVGIEANPVVQLMAETKTKWDVDTAALIKHAEAIAKEFQARIIQYGDNLKTLSNEQGKLIIKDSISPIPLHKALVLLEVMNEYYDPDFINYEKTAFAKQLVYAYSNLKFGPEVGVSRKKKLDADVIGLWLNQVNEIAKSIEFYDKQKNVISVVHLADSRNPGMKLLTNDIDAVITSPPYPNEKDYSRTTRLESVLLGFITSKEDLRRHKEGLLRSNTRNIYVNDTDEQWIAHNGRILELADSIEKRRIELEKDSGFEKLYHKVIKHYFGGMARHLEELKPKLRPGAKLAYVVGDQASYFRILIQTGEILADIARDAGYNVMNIDLFRTRLSTATKEQLREEVVLLQWNG